MRSQSFCFSRNARGGILPLLMLACTIISILTLVALAVCALLLVESRLRSTGENIGLQAAMQLNKGDRIGEINLMVERSRELVYTNRKTYDDLSVSAPHLEPLARFLLEDARAGVRKVDEERLLLASQIGKELEVKLTDEAKKARQAGPVNLMFFRLNQTENLTVDVGTVKDTPCNATCPLAIPELKEHDQKHNYLYDKTNYYRADVNARLPAPDDDLKFVFASLAPKIKDTIAQSRLINNDEFNKQVTLIAPGVLMRPKLRVLPSAIRVTTRTGIDAPANLHENMAMTIISTSNGAEKEE